MSVIFRNESRPDLSEVAGQLNFTAEYLTPIIFPTINVYEEGGQISVATRIAVSGDVNRAYNADLTLNHFGNTPIPYSCSGYDCRVVLTDSDLKNKGDDLDIIQAEAAKFGVEGSLGKIEASLPTVLGTATQTVTLASAQPYAKLAEASYMVADYGEPTLVCSQWFFTQLLAMPAFVEPILKLFGDRVITDIMTGNDQVSRAVGNWMGLGGIYLAKDEFWKGAVGSENPGFIVARRREMADPAQAYWTAKAKPCLGANLVFTPRGEEGHPFSVDTAYLPGPKLNAVDVTLKSIPKVFNIGAVAKVNLPG